MNDEVPGTIYGMSEWGWTDQELFLFLAETLSKLCQPWLPLLRHSFHFELGNIELAKEKRSQPLDSCVFGSLERIGLMCAMFTSNKT